MKRRRPKSEVWSFPDVGHSHSAKSALPQSTDIVRLARHVREVAKAVVALLALNTIAGSLKGLSFGVLRHRITRRQEI